MKRVFHILCVVAVLSVSCRGPQRIPRADMETIMYQLLLQDQYIKRHPEMRKTADTTLVYAGIFQQFGYDTDDFLYSLSYYLKDPARMEKVMGKVAGRLEADAKQAGIQLKEENWRADFMRIWKLPPDTIHLPRPVSPLDTLHVQFSKDSLFYIPHK